MEGGGPDEAITGQRGAVAAVAAPTAAAATAAAAAAAPSRTRKSRLYTRLLLQTGAGTIESKEEV